MGETPLYLLIAPALPDNQVQNQHTVNHQASEMKSERNILEHSTCRDPIDIRYHCGCELMSGQFILAIFEAILGAILFAILVIVKKNKGITFKA